MYIRIALTTVLLWCAGCTQESTPAASGQANHSGATASGVASATGIRPPVRIRSFANLPDRGDLVAYPARPVIRRDGAYTWHRAGLSEDHALQAVGGVMQITTPAGDRLRFQYERHVEHPSGDWTWIGRAKGGAASDEVVLTFGEHAVFGSISQPGQAPLKLTMGGGVSWLIETDRSQIAGIDNPATRPRKPDFLIPPKISAGSGASMESSTAAALSTTTVSAQVATTTVDVLLGYTSGFAAAQGGQSQAVTRLNNMVEIANQAYANSQVEARIRLVHAMQVSYPDNTANDAALEALTGFRAPNTPTTPDPAFAALRSARDQYGADLVSLVRRFYSPENDGCGIAWLIGGGQSGIDSRDEFFGYSVVSDGRDAGTDGKTYYCREETLAHELGHNMGSQHDSATATVDGSLKYGVYPYSFGLKTGATTGNLYTVMAYGDKGQVDYRTFSNPRSVFCGVPCGTDNEADNARSLVQAMPIVATFRASIVPTAVPVKNDFNGDGQSDVLWRNSGNGSNTIWRSGNSATGQIVTSVPPPAWQIVGVGDFDADGRSDILWRNSSTGANAIWRSGNSDTGQVVTTVGPQAWQVAGVGDFDGDGRSDILWRNNSTGANTIWRSGNSATGQAVTTVPVGAWNIVGVGDFDGDGRSDILWRNGTTGVNTIWRSGNSATGQAVTSVPASGWTIVGVGDFNGDGRSDIVWRNTSSGANAIWQSANSATQQPAATVNNQAWKVVATGDYDGDGQSDIFWRNSSNGANAIWRAGNAATQLPVSAVPNPEWIVKG